MLRDINCMVGAVFGLLTRKVGVIKSCDCFWAASPSDGDLLLPAKLLHVILKTKQKKHMKAKTTTVACFYNVSHSFYEGKHKNVPDSCIGPQDVQCRSSSQTLAAHPSSTSSCEVAHLDSQTLLVVHPDCSWPQILAWETGKVFITDV